MEESIVDDYENDFEPDESARDNKKTTIQQKPAPSSIFASNNNARQQTNPLSDEQSSLGYEEKDDFDNYF